MEDFKILIDGKNYQDSTIKKVDLLKAKNLNSNFSWLTIDRFTVYVTSLLGSGITDPSIIICTGSMICNDAKALFEKFGKKSLVVIIANEATNKQGVNLPMKDLSFFVVE